MRKNKLIYLPLTLIVIGMVLLLLSIVAQKPLNRIELKSPIDGLINPPTQSPVEESSPSGIISPVPTNMVEKLNNDFNEISVDIRKIEREDNRFTPPAYTFDMGLNQ